MTGSSQTRPSLDAILAVWREMLGPGEVAADDNFFEAGGTSLLATRISSRLTVALGCKVTAADILAHPSARKLSQKLSGNEASLDRSLTEERASMQRNAFAGSRPVRLPR